MDHYSYSTLNIPCPRAMWCKAHKKPNEILIADETDRGRKTHSLLAEAIETGNTREYKEYAEQEPKRLFSFIDKVYIPTGNILIEEELLFAVGKYSVKSRVDLVVDKKDYLAIIDHKTSASTKITKDIISQLELYAYPYMLENKPVKTFAYFTRYDNLKETKKEYLPFDREKIGKRIIKKIEAFNEIAKVKKEPNPDSSWYCNYCPYILSCPSIETDKPEEIMKEIIKIEAKLKALKKLARIFTENEPLNVAGYTFGYSTVEYLDVDKGEFIALVEKLKGNLADYISIGKANTVKATKELGDEISSIIQARIETKWGYKKIKEAQ